MCLETSSQRICSITFPGTGSWDWEACNSLDPPSCLSSRTLWHLPFLHHQKPLLVARTSQQCPRSSLSTMWWSPSVSWTCACPIDLGCPPCCRLRCHTFVTFSCYPTSLKPVTPDYTTHSQTGKLPIKINENLAFVFTLFGLWTKPCSLLVCLLSDQEWKFRYKQQWEFLPSKTTLWPSLPFSAN